VRTSRARSKIRHWVHTNERGEATEVGRRLLEGEARQFGRSLKRIPEADLLRVAGEYGCGKMDDLYAELGYGKYSARQILSKALGETLGEPAVSEPRPKSGPARIVSGVKRALGMGAAEAIRVRGNSGLMVFLAKCCNPIPGDEIVGYVTRGRGVAVHLKACPNVQNLLYESERKIDVSWAEAEGTQYTVSLIIRTQNRPGVLADITAVISAAGSNIQTLASQPDKLNARVEATLDIINRKQLEKIVANVKKISGVFGVERVYKI
jgi:GTP diphosphokinase / guanosine-3',5'-bis(diphosphate) 3'-diphosphatase